MTLFIVLAIVSFLLFQVNSSFNAKYSRCSDFSPIADFVGNYRRTSSALTVLFLSQMILCSWLAIAPFEIAIGIAGLLLYIIAFCAMCGIAYCVGTTFISIFTTWSLYEIQSRWYDFKDRYQNRYLRFKRDFKENRVDVLSSFFLIVTTLILFGTTLIDMGWMLWLQNWK